MLNDAIKKLQDRDRQMAVSRLAVFALDTRNPRDKAVLYRSYSDLFDLYYDVFRPCSDKEILQCHRVKWEQGIKILAKQIIKAWYCDHGGHLIGGEKDLEWRTTQ